LKKGKCRTCFGSVQKTASLSFLFSSALRSLPFHFEKEKEKKNGEEEKRQGERDREPSTTQDNKQAVC
jgi:hypothetical protein